MGMLMIIMLIPVKERLVLLHRQRRKDRVLYTYLGVRGKWKLTTKALKSPPPPNRKIFHNCNIK